MSDIKAALDFESTRDEFEKATAHFSGAGFARDEHGIYIHLPHHHRWEGWCAAHAKFFELRVEYYSPSNNELLL